MADRRVEFAQDGIVSLWVGAFPTPEAADAYFAEDFGPGRWEPARFSVEFGLGYYPPWRLETNFQSAEPQSIAELLRDATFAPTFADRAAVAATRRGFAKAQGAALLYDFDYRLKPNRQDRAGPITFVDSFAFVKTRPNADLGRLAPVSDRTGHSLAAVVHVITTLERLAQADRKQGGPGQVSARGLCTALTNGGAAAERVLREFGLMQSEDVGRVIYGMIEAKLFRAGPGESEADFTRLYALTGESEPGR
jgi:uncharacterized repeat protein (TIGR04138 family)